LQPEPETLIHRLYVVTWVVGSQ